MKKRICFLVVFILTVLSILTIDLPVYAENSGIRIYYESQNVQKGDIVSIPISVQNNSGIMGLGLEIHYDKNVFEIQSLIKGDVLKKVFLIPLYRKEQIRQVILKHCGAIQILLS